jgi:cell division protein FtsZ
MEAGSIANGPRIGIIAVGGISRAVLANTTFDFPHPVRTVAINTDAASLQKVQADHKILLQGFDSHLPELDVVDRNAAQVLPDLDIAVTDLDMVLLVAGLGGAAGTGIAPVVTQRLQDKNILTLVVAIRPFDFEGEDRQSIADLGFARLKMQASAMIAICNSDIENAVNPNDSLDAVMAHVPNTIHQLCRGVAGALGNSGLIGVEFEDLRSAITGHAGQCAFGYGVADTCIKATDLAIKHPFLNLSNQQHASAVLVAIEGPPDTMTMQEMKRVLYMVSSHLPVGAAVFYSSVANPARLHQTYTVSILAAGVQEKKNR